MKILLVVSIFTFVVMAWYSNVSPTTITAQPNKVWKDYDSAGDYQGWCDEKFPDELHDICIDEMKKRGYLK